MANTPKALTGPMADQIIKSGRPISLTDRYGDTGIVTLTKRDRWHVYGIGAGTDFENKFDRADIIKWEYAA